MPGDDQFEFVEYPPGVNAYGFVWGPARVERCAEFIRGDKTSRVVRIITPTRSQLLNIYISDTGRSVRVFRGGVELKPAP